MSDRPDGEAPRRVAVVTGTRAEFGLLVPVMRAIEAHPGLELRVVAAGSHFMEPARTIQEVRASFDVAAEVRIQQAGHATRLDDARAVGRGVLGFADAFEAIRPDWVLVLGDRIEAFGAAACASVGGLALAHVHGGDRAEGIADEAMRHAITKLAHVHFAASAQSAGRIRRMGEPSDRIIYAGSPAIDGLDRVAPMNDDDARALGDPRAIVLLHPSGLSEQRERAIARRVAGLVGECGPVLWLEPNHDAGRAWVIDELSRAPGAQAWTRRAHLARPAFLALLRRLGERDGMIVGNSSAALIEAAALGVRAIDVGPRQGGRERPGSVTHVDEGDERAPAQIREQLARINPRDLPPHPYGDGRAGPTIASALAGDPPHEALNPRSPSFTRKRNVH